MKAICLLAIAAALPAAENNLTTTAKERYFNVVRRNLEASADQMPAEKYGFRLTDGQMTFAEWLIHATQRNWSDCAVLKGEPTPAAEKEALLLKNKDEVGKALKESFAYCAAALEAVTDRSATASQASSYAFLHLVVHNNEIYGNVVGYLRVNGILPPSTASRKGQQKK